MSAVMEKVRWAILDSVADDYEPMEMIMGAVQGLVSETDERVVKD